LFCEAKIKKYRPYKYYISRIYLTNTTKVYYKFFIDREKYFETFFLKKYENTKTQSLIFNP